MQAETISNFILTETSPLKHLYLSLVKEMKYWHDMNNRQVIFV